MSNSYLCENGYAAGGKDFLQALNVSGAVTGFLTV